MTAAPPALHSTNVTLLRDKYKRKAERRVAEYRGATHVIARQDQLRKAFWEAHPNLAPHFRPGKRQNSYKADIRMAFVDFVDHLAKSGEISQGLASRVTL